MESAHGNVTIAALLATGATTLGFALAGVVGLGDRLRASDAARQAPTVQQVQGAVDSDAAATTPPQAPTTPTAAPREREL